jgi:hypothetical protein
MDHAHPVTHIAHGDIEAEVDRGIAPLVLEAWRAGVTTRQSCEEDPHGLVWLQFETIVDLLDFLTIVSGNSFQRRSLYDRLLYGYDRIAEPCANQWRYEIVVHDLAVDEVEIRDGVWKEIHLGSPMFQAFVSVRFPRRDIPPVFHRLKKYNRAVDRRQP